MKPAYFSAFAAPFLLGASIFATSNVANICVAQDWSFSEAHNATICDPFPPTAFLPVPNAKTGELPGFVKLEPGLDARNADFRGVKIRNVKVENANFSGCDFTGADFRQAIFVRCDFSKAVLRDVRSDELTSYVDCVFDDATLENFNAKPLPLDVLRSTRSFREKTLKGVRFADRPYLADLSGFTLGGSLGAARRNLTDATLVGGVFYDLTSDQLRQTRNFQTKRYEGLTLLVSDLGTERKTLDYRGFDFSGALLRGCRFSDLDLTDADFTDAVLVDCDLFLTREQLATTWNWKAGRLAVAFADSARPLRPELEARIAEEKAQREER